MSLWHFLSNAETFDFFFIVLFSPRALPYLICIQNLPEMKCCTQVVLSDNWSFVGGLPYPITQPCWLGNFLNSFITCPNFYSKETKEEINIIHYCSVQWCNLLSSALDSCQLTHLKSHSLIPSPLLVCTHSSNRHMLYLFCVFVLKLNGKIDYIYFL